MESSDLSKAHGSRRWRLWSAASATVLCLVVLWLVLVAAPRERERFAAAARAQREAMADDRAAAIDAWLRAGIGDARLLASYPTVAHLAAGESVIGAAPGVGPRSHLVTLLGGFLALKGYSTAAVLAADLRVVGATPPDYVPGAGVLEMARECLAGGEQVVRMHRSPGGEPTVAFAVPVLGAGGGSRAHGVVVLREDPRRWLYPFLAHHPQVSATGESLLVQREGDEVVFIAPLRHSEAPPATLRESLAGSTLAGAAAYAAGGVFGRYEDYRAVAVLAAPRAIRNAPWGLVAKVDEDEVLAPYRRWVRGAAALVGVFALAFGGLVYGLWRREGDRRALALARSESELARLLGQANDAVLSISRAGVIVRANQRAEAMYGYRGEELRGMPVTSLHRPGKREEVARILAAVAESGRDEVATEHLRKDGSVFPVEASASFVAGAEGGRFLVIVRDVSERHRAEERIRRLNRLLRTISEVNQLVVRERDPEALLATACRVVVELGGLALVWVGVRDDATGEVRSVCAAGAAAPALAGVSVQTAGEQECWLPTALAHREQRKVLVADWSCAADIAPPPPWARAAGLRSVAAFPLSGGTFARGSLTAYATEPDVFDTEVVALLEEMVADLAFALDAIAATTALERQDRLLREMSRMASIGGWELDPATGNGSWTEEVARIHGLDPSTSTSAALGLSFYTPESRVRIDAAIAAAVADGTPYDLELEMMTTDGARKWVRSVGMPTRVDARVVRLGGTLQDITERKRAEMALRTSEQRYRSLFDNMLNGLAYCRMIFDGERPTDFVYLAVNRAFESLTGLQDVVGKRVSEVIPGIREADPELLETYGRVARTGASERFETYVKALEMWFSISVYSPGPGLFVAVFDVVTERKRMEREILEANLRLRELVEAIKALAAARGIGEVAAVVRTSARSLTGADGATFVLRSGDDCHYVDEDAISPLWKGRRFPLGECISGWAMLNRAAAVAPDIYADPRIPADAYRSTFVRSLAVVPIRRDDPLGAIGAYWAEARTATDGEVALLQTLADATARAVENVRLLEDLENRVCDRTAQLEAANRELEAFSYSVSHDLRAPLRAIDGFSRILQEDYGHGLDDEARRLIAVVRENAQRMGQLIDDLLAFSRLGRTDLRRGMVDMRALTDAVAAEVRHAGDYARAELIIGELPTALADPGLVRQVWSNLLSNAFKFSSRVACPRIEVRGRIESGEMLYEVTDNGAGFEPRYADKLFGVFQRLHSATEFPGTGVGLALVQRIVARHGGRVWASGAPQQGATFGFSLPVGRGEGS